MLIQSERIFMGNFKDAQKVSKIKMENFYDG